MTFRLTYPCLVPVELATQGNLRATIGELSFAFFLPFFFPFSSSCFLKETRGPRPTAKDDLLSLFFVLFAFQPVQESVCGGKGGSPRLLWTTVKFNLAP